MLLYTLLWFVLLMGLGLAAWFDVRTECIPVWLTVSGAAVGLLLHGCFLGWHGALTNLLAAVLWFTIGWFGTRATRRLGAGDFDVLSMVAAFMGAFGPVLVLVAGFTVQGFVYLVAFARGDMRLERPLVPGLFGGAVLIFVWQLSQAGR